jgi:hypothetical protein
MATGWANLLEFFYGCPVDDCMWMGIRIIVLGSNMRFPSGLYGPCFDERFSLKKSLGHTLLKIT